MARLAKRSISPEETASKKSKLPKTTGKFDVEASESRILESATNYNELLTVLEKLVSAKSSEKYFEISASLVKIFGVLAKRGVLTKKKIADKTKKAVASWLIERYSEFFKVLCDKVSQDEDDYAAISLAALLKLVTIESKYFSNDDYYYPKASFREIIGSCLRSRTGLDALSSVAEEYQHYDDFRFYLYQELAYLLSDQEHSELQAACKNYKSSTKIVDTLLSIIDTQVKLDTGAKDDELSGNWWLAEPIASKTSLKQSTPLKVSSQKIAFQKCWLAVLRLPQSTKQHHKVMAVLHKKLIPNMAQPQMLMDYLTDAYNDGDVMSFLALNGVFFLMQKYNLDYPDFFTKLYALFQDGSVMHVRYRSRVLRLLDLFLSSSHLPSAIMASFIKKMARLALSSPIGAVVSILPFIYNQLKRHPSCMVMIHKPNASGETVDPFDILETNPLKTKAFESSLWEIESLQHHYHPNVATLARIFSQPFHKPQYGLEDFLDYNYKSLVEAERARKMKVVPALEFESFDHVFGEHGYIEAVSW